jgi:Zn-dependent protease
MAAPSGALRLFRLGGVDVYVHWGWLVIGYVAIRWRERGPLSYESSNWNVVEFLAIFAIVLMHEFGHAFAGLQVGGRVQYIMLWPLGGVTYVITPPRPGALLWSISAGPLVNILVLPITIGLLVHNLGPGGLKNLEHANDFTKFWFWITALNLFMTIFNLLPIYPMDGGQILQALLWFVIGRINSLIAVSILGLIGAVGFVLWAVSAQSLWLGVMAAYIGFRSYAGFHQAQQLSKLLNGPRHHDAACPSCGETPFAGNYWVCDQCGERFDAFEHQALCPGCGNAFPSTMCPSCHRRHPIAEWLKKATPESVAAEHEPPV